MKVGSLSLVKFVAGGHKLFAEAENNNPENGYQFINLTGSSTAQGWRCEEGLHPPGWAIDSLYGSKCYSKYSRDYLRTQIRLMTWDIGTPDTICNVIFITYHGQYDTAEISISGTTFDSPGEWKSIVVGYLPTSAWSQFTVKLLWFGQRTLEIDRIEVDDYWGQVFHRWTDSAIISAFDGYRGRIVDSSHYGFYPADEPVPMKYSVMKRFDDLGSISMPGHRTMASEHYDPHLFIRELNPREILPIGYQILNKHSSSTTDDSSSIQYAYEELTKIYAKYGQISKETNVPMWQIIQAGQINGTCSAGTLYDCPTCGRELSGNELRTQCNLALTYGAKGIGYFVYRDLHQPFYQDTIGCYDEALNILYGTVPNCNNYRNPDSCPIVSHGGLMRYDIDSNKYVPKDIWYDAKAINSMFDSLSDTLASVHWVNANSWDSLDLISGCMIDSIYSLKYPSSKTFIEIGRFELMSRVV